ncbi:hypothetical protein NG791_25650 [Laspinema sp. D1]|uniref:hypothetical protein n=1 Tax=Laspinema palackyanum TaxID=3231601 RepID=UPI003482800A|nr:hypothetical protein [Laspinema sp. D2b]
MPSNPKAVLFPMKKMAPSFEAIALRGPRLIANLSPQKLGPHPKVVQLAREKWLRGLRRSLRQYQTGQEWPRRLKRLPAA